MILRTSSAPFLAALLPEGDNEAPVFSRPSAAPTYHAFNRLPQNTKGLSSRPTPQMRRAYSETDLQGLKLSSSTEADEQRRTGERKMDHVQVHSFPKLPVIEEKDSRLCIHALDMVKNHLGTDASLRTACSGQGRNAKPSVCLPARPSSRVPVQGACGIPQVEERKRLNPLFMASGTGTVAKADQALGGSHGCDGGSRGSSGAGGSSQSSSSPHGDSDSTDLYYQNLLQSDPQNPLFLRNYAQFLSEAKHDYHKSEEFYERAILACPNDGEVLSKYAKHVWDVHKDSERAASYFGQAVEATPDDCYVLASYAAFLWEAEENVPNDNAKALPTAFGSLHGTCAVQPSPLVASG